MKHQMWEHLLQSMSRGGQSVVDGQEYGPGGSHAMLGKVLSRAALAREPVPRSEISKGSMLIRKTALASGTVGKAADALVGEGLLTAEKSVKSGQPGPPITPLRLGSPAWAIAGIHIDQQHDGPDKLTGIICGLDRKQLCAPVSMEVPKKGDQHDLGDLAGDIRKLTETLLAQLAEPRKFLGVGVELGGHVHRGVVPDSTHAGWNQVDLCQVLTKELSEIPELQGVPVVIENDVNALAIYGYYEGSFEALDIALVSVFRQGVGGALILDGRMYRGFGSMAPEPGHLAAEYPEDQPGWKPPSAPSTVAGRTFDDECLCSTEHRKAYGHVDTLATPARIEGQLAALKPDEKIGLEQAAATPLAIPSGDQLVFAQEAVVLRRAGRALGRGLRDMINTLNPGQLVLRLPAALATPAPQTSGTEYLDAVEREIDGAYSTGPDDARGNNLPDVQGKNHRLAVQSYADDDQIAGEGAVAAATTVFNAFIEHARGSDGCPPDGDGKRPTEPSRHREPRVPAAIQSA